MHIEIVNPEHWIFGNKTTTTGSKLTLPLFLDRQSVCMTVAHRTFAHGTFAHLMGYLGGVLQTPVPIRTLKSSS